MFFLYRLFDSIDTNYRYNLPVVDVATTPYRLQPRLTREAGLQVVPERKGNE